MRICEILRVAAAIPAFCVEIEIAFSVSYSVCIYTKVLGVRSSVEDPKENLEQWNSYVNGFLAMTVVDAPA